MRGVESLSGIVLGIDGGGSKTVALLAGLDGQLFARGVAGPSNYQAIGSERAFAALDGAVRAVADHGAPDAICLGMAGVARPGDVALFREWAGVRWPGKPVVIVNDADLVLAAGTPDGWGLGLICGTGSIVYGRNMAGEWARAGGWGYLLGDEGSGYFIALAALRAVTRAADGRAAPTGLTDAVLARWSLAAPQDLIPRIYGERMAPAEIAALAVLVDEVAAGGDATAAEIIHTAAHELALALGAVARRLAFAGAIPCALAGGMIVNSVTFRERVLEAASQQDIELAPVEVVWEPALGAVKMARALVDPDAQPARNPTVAANT